MPNTKRKPARPPAHESTDTAPKDYSDGPLGHCVRFLKQFAVELSLSPDAKLSQRAAKHVLSGGAFLELRAGTDAAGQPVWRLRVSREGVYPSDTEIGVFALAFGATELTHPPEKQLVQSDPPRSAFVLQWALTHDEQVQYLDAEPIVERIAAPALAPRAEPLAAYL